MRWKHFWSLLTVALLFYGGFMFLVWRAEWTLHVVARKDFFYPSDAPHPRRYIAEIRRRYPRHDWQSLWRKLPGVYMQYECRIRDDDDILTSSFWVFADHPQPSVYSLSPQDLTSDNPKVVFDLSGEVLTCEFTFGAHFCWRNAWDPFWHPAERN